MKINIYSIIKPSKDEFDSIIQEFLKMSSKYAKVEVFYIFNKNIAKAQTIGEKEAQQSYSETYEPLLKGFNIALDVLGKKVDTYAFSALLERLSESFAFLSSSPSGDAYATTSVLTMFMRSLALIASIAAWKSLIDFDESWLFLTSALLML